MLLALINVFEGSPTFTSMKSHSLQGHRVDSCQTLLSEELVTNPFTLIFNESFVLGWPLSVFLQGTSKVSFAYTSFKVTVYL